MTGLLLACGIAGPLLFILVFMLEGAIRPRYRPWRHFVSLLAHGPRGWVQTASFFVCGALCLCFAVGRWRASEGVAMPALIAVFGAALLASGRFRCDPGLGYPLGAPATWPRTASREGTRHNVAGLVAFVSLAVACFVEAKRADGAWMIYSLLAGLLVLVLFVVTGVLAERDSRGQVSDPPIGVAQRLAIVIGWSWLAMLALLTR